MATPRTAVNRQVLAFQLLTAAGAIDLVVTIIYVCLAPTIHWDWVFLELAIIYILLISMGFWVVVQLKRHGQTKGAFWLLVLTSPFIVGLVFFAFLCIFKQDILLVPWLRVLPMFVAHLALIAAYLFAVFSTCKSNPRHHSGQDIRIGRDPEAAQ